MLCLASLLLCAPPSRPPTPPPPSTPPTPPGFAPTNNTTPPDDGPLIAGLNIQIVSPTVANAMTNAVIQQVTTSPPPSVPVVAPPAPPAVCPAPPFDFAEHYFAVSYTARSSSSAAIEARGDVCGEVPIIERL